MSNLNVFRSSRSSGSRRASFLASRSFAESAVELGSSSVSLLSELLLESELRLLALEIDLRLGLADRLLEDDEDEDEEEEDDDDDDDRLAGSLSSEMILRPRRSRRKVVDASVWKKFKIQK